jgi:hypothetical protein
VESELLCRSYSIYIFSLSGSASLCLSASLSPPLPLSFSLGLHFRLEWVIRPELIDCDPHPHRIHSPSATLLRTTTTTACSQAPVAARAPTITLLSAVSSRATTARPLRGHTRLWGKRMDNDGHLDDALASTSFSLLQCYSQLAYEVGDTQTFVDPSNPISCFSQCKSFNEAIISTTVAVNRTPISGRDLHPSQKSSPSSRSVQSILL